MSDGWTLVFVIACLVFFGLFCHAVAIWNGAMMIITAFSTVMLTLGLIAAINEPDSRTPNNPRPDWQKIEANVDSVLQFRRSVRQRHES